MKYLSVITALRTIAVIAFGAVVIYFAIISEGPLPDHPVLQGKNDLFLHAAAFFVLALVLPLSGSRIRDLTVLAAFAGLIEIVQSFLPLRNADWIDFTGSVAGIALGLLLRAGLGAIAALMTAQKEQLDE